MSDKFLLWGFRRASVNRWVKLAGGPLPGCIAEQRERKAQGWKLTILKPFLHPEENKETPNARFWIFQYGSPVKITLKPGESLCFGEGGKTEEGYARSSECYTHRGDHVSNEWHQEGRDCDGYIESNGVSVCRIDELRSIPVDEQFPYFPRDNWVKGNAEIYDESAVLAGY